MLDAFNNTQQYVDRCAQLGKRGSSKTFVMPSYHLYTKKHYDTFIQNGRNLPE